MSISYPLVAPTDTLGIAQIELSAQNAIAVSRSPFTFATQVHAYPGQAWVADVTVARQRKEFAEPWVAMLTALRGQFGTFLLGDPNAVNPRGTSTSATVSGQSGDSSLTVSMSGSLLAGDYIQLGSGPNATLHKVLVDQSGSGTLEVWPALRKNRVDVNATLINPRGVFRLSENSVSWSIDSNNAYNINFQAIEAI